VTDPRPVITSARHPEVVALKKLLARPQRCRREGVFLLDGGHLFEEALCSPYAASVVFFAVRFLDHPRGRALHEQILSRGWPIRLLADRLIDSLAPTEHPQGILGIFGRARPTLPPPGASPERSPLAGLVLAGVQDPGNLGALARTAHALGCRRLLTTPGTVDPFHVRALRGSSGALLHLRIDTDLDPEALTGAARAEGAQLAALLPRGGDWPPAAGGRERVMLVLGSEGSGAEMRVEERCSLRWTIPTQAAAESLGVSAAGAIAMYATLVAAQRQAQA